MKYLESQGGKRISRVVQGITMITGENPRNDATLLDSFVQEGGTAFDAARHYGQGRNERAFGEWLRNTGEREKLFIIGKGAHPDETGPRVNPDAITRDLLASLDDLGCGHMDAYLLHRDDTTVPVDEVVDILDEHHRAGLIGEYGGSNWTFSRIREANAWARANGRLGFTVSSPNYSLAEQVNPPWPGCRTITGATAAAERDYYRDNGITVFAWSSVAGGFFSGRFRQDNLGQFTAEDDLTVVDAYAHPVNFGRLERAARLAERQGVTATQIALAWVLGQPLRLAALTGSRSVEEVRANAQASELELSVEELSWLYSGSTSEP